jgi:hypothetical protein
MKTKYFLALIILISLSISCGMLRESVKKMAGIDDEKRERLMKTGVSSKGIIEKVEDTYVTVNKNPKVRLYIKVTPDGGEKFDAVVEMIVSRVQIPRAGDNVRVWYDPKNRDDIIVE